MYRSGIGYDAHRFAGRTNSFSAESRFRMSADSKDIRTPTCSACDRRCIAWRDRRSATSGIIFQIPTKRFAASAVSKFCDTCGHCWRRKMRASTNIDATLIAEAPMIAAAYRQDANEDRRRAADAISSRVNVKATTNEGLGAIGRGEGMAALAGERGGGRLLLTMLSS